MMADSAEQDIENVSQALQCIRKSLECSLCRKLPTVTETARCGHPFCKTCVDKVLHTKKAVCPICKTVIIRSAVRRLESIDKIVKDFNSLCKAAEKDSKTTICLDKRQAAKQGQAKRNSTLPGPSKSQIEYDASSWSELSSEKPEKRNNRRGSKTAKIHRRESIDSEETIKIQKKKLSRKGEELTLEKQSTFKATDSNCEPIFTEDSLSVKIGTLGTEEKVEEWLNSEKFEGEAEEELEIPDILEPPKSNLSSPKEIPESFFQDVSNLGGFSISQRNSRASDTTNKNAQRLESTNTANNSQKYKSFTFEATDNKMRKSNPRPVSRAEKMFENLRRTTIDEQNVNKKSKIPSVSTASSWEEVKKLKKETHSNIRKRKRLNISIERPTAAKPVLGFSDSEEEKEAEDTNTITNEKNKSAELNDGNKADEETPEGRKKPNVVSSITLGPAELIDIQTLNRRQVREIIGIHDASKNSSNSADKSSIKSNTNLSPRRSGEHSRNNTNEEESTSHIEASSRPQSKQSNHPHDSRPGSRLSIKSDGKPAPEKFRLSTRKKSPTSNTGPLEVSGNLNAAQNQPGQEDQAKMKLGNDSPVRNCTDSIRNKLSLKRLLPGSNQTITRENKSTIVRMKKLGRLYKPSNRIKFLFLASTMPKSVRNKSLTTTRNASTQTLHSLTNSDLISKSTKHMSSESIGRIIIPETRTASAASSDSRLMDEAGTKAATTLAKIVAPNKSSEELDTANKVNMLSPDKDSQLKYLATRSPSVPRIESMNSDEKKRDGKSYTVMRETSFTNSDSVTPRLDEYSRAVKDKAEQLIATDSEDQDMPNENLSKIKRRHKHGAVKDGQDKATNSTTTSFVSKTTSISSDMRMDDKIETATTNADKSPSVHSIRNNLRENSSLLSPKRKRYSRDSPGSQTKSTEKLKSLSKTSDCFKKSTQSDSKNVPVEKLENTEATQPLEDSDASVITAKHKVVRKLKYTQESKTESGKSKNSDKSKGERTIAPRTFQRILRIPSSDSENELLEISLTTKESSSNSQNITGPGASREANKSPLLSEDMTVVFSSNKDTQESKRKRSPSPNSLDNKDLQAIASNWCADLDRSSEEIVAADDILGLAEDPSLDLVPLKKPRIEVQDLPNSDIFHALSMTTIHENRRKNSGIAKTAMEINNRSSNNEENALLMDLEDVAEQFDSIDENIPIGNNSVSKNNSKHVSLTRNVECSIKQGNTSNRIVTTTNNSSTPIKAKSLANGDRSSIDRQSQNSDKENETRGQRVRRQVENEKVLTNKRQKISSNSEEDLNELQSNCNVFKSNPGSFPSKNNSMSNTEVFDSFDRDCLNITQEEMLMQEVADNLLGRKSKQETVHKSPVKNSGKTFTTKEPSVNNANQMTKGHQIAQIDTDDSETMDEDIVESTPEKNLPLKKDSHAYVESSQKFNASMKSFMSLDITPIPKEVPRSLQLETDVSRTLSGNQTVLKNLSARSSRHSTPKSTSTILRKSQLSETKFNCLTKTKTKQKCRLCFVCSCLTLPQVQIVKSFAKMHNAEYMASYTPDITHVIVETNERNAAGRTLKYMLGVAHKKWIVSYRWVTDSMDENRILEEEDYEAVDSDTEEPGPRRSRLSKKGLFDEFAFLCMEPFSDITTSQLQDLLSSTGGTVVQSLEDLASVANKHKVILYNSEIHEDGVLENWRKKGQALPVQVEWALSCISQYDLVSFRYYLENVDSHVISDFGFPPELIAKEEEEEGEDSYAINERSALSTA